MTRTRPLFLLLAAGFIGAAGCSSSKTHLLPPPISPEDTVAEDSASATLSVQNDGFPDMDIHVLREDGMRYRLGTALGHQTTVLVIPKFVLIGPVTDLRFVADPINGQRASVSQTMSVSPGDQVDMIIPPG